MREKALIIDSAIRQMGEKVHGEEETRLVWEPSLTHYSGNPPLVVNEIRSTGLENVCVYVYVENECSTPTFAAIAYNMRKRKAGEGSIHTKQLDAKKRAMPR